MPGDVDTSGNGGTGKPAPGSDAALAAELANAKTAAAARRSLKKIAKKCENGVTNKLKDAVPKVNFPLSREDCRKAGIAKHKCCEKMVKKAGNPPVQAEVALDKTGKDLTDDYNKARKLASDEYLKAKGQGLDTKGLWYSVFKANRPNVHVVADVVFTDKNGRKHGFDFKFPCGGNKPKWGGNNQKGRYADIFKKRIGLISP